MLHDTTILNQNAKLCRFRCCSVLRFIKRPNPSFIILIKISFTVIYFLRMSRIDWTVQYEIYDLFFLTGSCQWDYVELNFLL